MPRKINKRKKIQTAKRAVCWPCLPERGLDMTKKWIGRAPSTDDFGFPITTEFYDAKTRHGPWAIMSPESYKTHGLAKLGTGMGQHYKKLGDDWLKVEG